MGLFKRHAETKQQLDALRSEVFYLRQRLEDTVVAKNELAEQFGILGTEHEQLTAHLGDVETKVVTVAASIEPAIADAVVHAASTADVEQLRNELAHLNGLSSHVDQLRETVAAQQLAVAANGDTGAEEQRELAARLEELAGALARQQQQIADVALVATDTAERTDLAMEELRTATQPGTTPERDAEVRSQLGQLAEKVGAIDSRVQQVSLELTNQLTELSGELDRASARADAIEAIEQLTARVEDVTGGQHRLANEQARYAIQFREDLAELADRLQRPGRV